jgi:membrane protease YdiL (CAAX protease family)
MISKSRTSPVHGSWALLALFAGLHTLLLWFFNSLWFQAHVSGPVRIGTGGMIPHAALVGSIEFVVLVVGVMILAGGLRFADVGLVRANLANAGIVLLLLWGCVQLVVVIAGHLGAGAVELNPKFAASSSRALLGLGLQSTVGSGFIEEVMYRGFVLPQLYFLSRRWGLSEKRGLACALIGSQLFFSINHIPAAQNLGLGFADTLGYLAYLFMLGFILAALFMRTGNLFIAVGVHALLNNPVPLFVSSLDPALVVLVFSCLFLLLWPSLARLFDEVFTIRTTLKEVWARQPAAGSL